MDRQPDERALELASFRYRIIADAIDAGDEAVVQALTAAAARTYIEPKGQPVRFSLRTLWRWLHCYRRGGLLALCPKLRKDRGQLHAFKPELLERAQALRREQSSRSTKTLIDILEREQKVGKGLLARSTLDRHLQRLGLSRRRLHDLGQKIFRRIKTDHPFELVVCDFHHGPYVRLDSSDPLRRSLLCAFIDHYSRYVPEGRYYLHEDFAALRFALRRLLTAFGLFENLYVDHGPSYQAGRFHAACSALAIHLIQSKPYQAEGRGVIERFNRTLKEQFEAEVRAREEPLTLDQLNAYFEAWLAERYHGDRHSEIGEPPRDRFQRTVTLRAAPPLEQLDELLRLRERRTVHKKWSTVELLTTRYLVDSALRGRKVDVLYDPFQLDYLLIVFDGRVVQRAFPQKPGEAPPQPEPPSPQSPSTDYLALLRRDFERRTQTELTALRLRPAVARPELSLSELGVLLERCRAVPLSAVECSAVAAFFRKMRPIDPQHAQTALDHARQKLGSALHLSVYLDALNAYLVRQRTQKGEPKS